MAGSRRSEYANRELAADTGMLARQGMLRRERWVEKREGPRIRIDGHWLINFCSNDYLGLASHPRIIKALQNAAEEYGVGSSASPLVSGKSELHRKLELKLADLTGRERALIVSSGYAANLAIQSALVKSRSQLIVQDRLCHASTVDATALTRCRIKRYRHSDVNALDKILGAVPDQSALVFTESVFSMDGDIAPLPELARTCRKHGACLIVDDAHAFGVMGARGLGALDHFSLGQQDVPVMMATFGKAAGAYGAFVAGPDALIETLIQRARPYIYSTALPPALIAAADAALEVMLEESWRRQRLVMLTDRFRNGAKRLGIPLAASTSAIQPVIIGDAGVTLACSQFLEKQGFFISAIRPPTVPQNSSRLRITLSAAHTEGQVDSLLTALQLCIQTHGRVVP